MINNTNTSTCTRHVDINNSKPENINLIADEKFIFNFLNGNLPSINGFDNTHEHYINNVILALEDTIANLEEQIATKSCAAFALISIYLGNYDNNYNIKYANSDKVLQTLDNALRLFIIHEGSSSSYNHGDNFYNLLILPDEANIHKYNVFFDQAEIRLGITNILKLVKIFISKKCHYNPHIVVIVKVLQLAITLTDNDDKTSKDILTDIIKEYIMFIEPRDDTGLDYIEKPIKNFVRGFYGYNNSQALLNINTIFGSNQSQRFIDRCSKIFAMPPVQTSLPGAPNNHAGQKRNRIGESTSSQSQPVKKPCIKISSATQHPSNVEENTKINLAKNRMDKIRYSIFKLGFSGYSSILIYGGIKDFRLEDFNTFLMHHIEIFRRLLRLGFSDEYIARLIYNSIYDYKKQIIEAFVDNINMLEFFIRDMGCTAKQFTNFFGKLVSSNLIEGVSILSNIKEINIFGNELQELINDNQINLRTIKYILSNPIYSSVERNIRLITTRAREFKVLHPDGYTDEAFRKFLKHCSMSV